MWAIIILTPFLFTLILMGIVYIFETLKLSEECGEVVGFFLMLPLIMGWMVLAIIKVFEIINKLI